MFKIRLLILLLINFLIVSCSNYSGDKKIKLSVGYISGEYDGLVLSNQLMSDLNNFGMLDKKSIYKIQASISHSQNLFITNIDNTSDRERITSSVEINIYNEQLDCITHKFTEDVSQFYVLAPSDRFISNKTAVEEIKLQNTQYFVRKFINGLTDESLNCNSIKQ